MRHYDTYIFIFLYLSGHFVFIFSDSNSNLLVEYNLIYSGHSQNLSLTN